MKGILAQFMAMIVVISALPAGASEVSLSAIKIRIDTAAARAVLQALGSPNLDMAKARAIADLPGNQGMIQKITELSKFGGAARAPETRETFATALVSAARGEGKDSPFGFVGVQAKRQVTLELLDRIDNEPTEFADWIRARVSPYLPPSGRGQVTGYVIAGGSADGFSFESPDFYLAINHFGDDFGGARVIMAHELYHAVQNLAQLGAPKSAAFDYDNKYYASLAAGQARACYATQALFASLLAEGTATFVGDPMLLPSIGTYSTEERKRRSGIRGNVKSARTLLEMSVRSVTGAHPMSEEDVYAVGFLNNAPLYDLGYVMARAIADRDGPAELGRLIGQPGQAFVARYVAISEQPSSTLPRLGADTRAWAQNPNCNVS